MLLRFMKLEACLLAHAEEKEKDYAQKFLNHKLATMTDKCRDVRGVEWIWM